MGVVLVGRLDRDQMFMMMAVVASYRSTCNRLKVGAILVKDNRPVSMGYNGSPPGMPHCGGECGPGKPCLNTIHAEYNAIHWSGLTDLDGYTLYTTHSPCSMCAMLIAGAGVSKVVYNEKFRDESPLEILKSCMIEVKQCPVDLVINVS